MPEEFRLTGWPKLGALVRDTRLSQGLSQAALAARAGVARSWLTRVEAGHRGAELEPLLRLLAALDLVSPCDQTATRHRRSRAPSGPVPHPRRGRAPSRTNRTTSAPTSGRPRERAGPPGACRRLTPGAPTMTERLTVLLSGEVVGYLERAASDEDPTFSSTAEYVRDGEVATLRAPASPTSRTPGEESRAVPVRAASRERGRARRVVRPDRGPGRRRLQHSRGDGRGLSGGRPVLSGGGSGGASGPRR